MITRIVQLEFEEDKINEFLSYFDTIKDDVNTFPGCYGMKLYQDIHRRSIVMTYSLWENEAALEVYRNSETFGTIWSKIKPWFSGKPQAWSVSKYFDGFS